MDERELANKILKDPNLLKLSGLAREKYVSLFLVGGYIRDLLLNTPRSPGWQGGVDYDFSLPKEDLPFLSAIEEIFQIHFFKVGKEEANTLTYRAIQGEISIDITSFQGKTIEEDLQRRDFTINSIAFSLLDEKTHSSERALEDIEKRWIRMTSPSSIDQDPLRMLRAIRYLCSLEGFRLEERLEKEISSKKELIRAVPSERIKMELDHILLSSHPATGMNYLYETGLLFILMEELKGLEGLGQSEHHHLHVLGHILLMMDKIRWALHWVLQNGKRMNLTREDYLTLYYAALFHDLGKQDTYSQDEMGKVHFYQHESFSCQRAGGMMERLRFSNLMRDRVLRLIRHHMRILNLSEETKETALKRLIHQMGEETPLLVLHTLADKEASRGILSIQMDEVIERNCLRILKLFEEKEILHPPFLITGHDVMALGYPPGPKVGEILNDIREKQVEGEIKTREEALEVLKNRFST